MGRRGHFRAQPRGMDHRGQHDRPGAHHLYTGRSGMPVVRQVSVPRA